MTEYEKKQRGEIYDARDPEIRARYQRGKDWAKVYNSLPAADAQARELVLRQFLGGIGRNVRVNPPFFVDYGTNITLGDNCFVNMNCTLLDTGRIKIGENTLLGPDVKIYTAQHPLDGAERFWREADGTMAIKTATRPVTIGRYVWVGGGAIILPGVTIGDNAVIGAGSVVTEDIPANAIACGNPCTVKKWNAALPVHR